MMFRLPLILIAVLAAVNEVGAAELTTDNFQLVATGAEILEKLNKIQGKAKALVPGQKTKDISRILSETCRIQLNCPNFMQKFNQLCGTINADLQILETLNANAKDQFKKKCNQISETIIGFVNGLPKLFLSECKSEFGPLVQVLEKVISIIENSDGVINYWAILGVLRGLLGGGLEGILKVLGTGGIGAVLNLLDTVVTVLGTVQGVAGTLGLGNILAGDNGLFNSALDLLGNGGLLSLGGLLDVGGLIGSLLIPLIGGGGIGSLLGGLLGPLGSILSLVSGILKPVLGLVNGLLGPLLG